MHDLNKYVSGLLFIHDCVILPGFGGLVTNYHNAEHNELSSTFYPPKKDVLFNKNLTYNDGLLINYLAKNLDISYEEAEKRIKEEVQKSWLKLDKGQQVSFDGVGSFRYDKDQNMVFTPEDSENFLTDAYGLSSFRFPPLNYQKNVHNIIPLHKHTHMDEDVKTTLKWVAAAVAIVAIAILSLIPYQKNKSLQQIAGVTFDTATKKPSELVHSAMPADTNVAEVIDQTTDKRLALFYNEEAEATVKKQETTGLTFHIIGGSYKDESNALEDVAFFKQKGFNAKVINANELYRVSLAEFDSKVNALHELRRIRNEEQNDNVWLLSQR
ncbi:MAG: SPOR domain-containing protein [Salinivirgaceae bacterium]|jgi:nucleoid DNA-binding protein|nr:SPOR domain-containing protein [Salinivirgaceae bacterium]